MMRANSLRSALTSTCALLACAMLSAQAPPTKPGQTTANAAKPNTSPAKPAPPALPPSTLPSDYLIGASDVLAVQTDVPLGAGVVGGDLIVRPDGKISLSLVNDVQAAGLTVDALREGLVKAFTPYKSDPTVLVQVKTINSRVVFITGAVGKAGAYPLTDHMRVSQLIALAGGLAEFADKEHISITRMVNGKLVGYRYNWKEVSRLKNLKQDIELMSGDTVIVN